MKTQLPTTLILDGHPALRIEAALRKRDSSTIWSLASTATQSEEFFNQLRDCTFHVGHHGVDQTGSATEHQFHAMFSSMLLWPVVLDRRLLSGSGAVRDALSTESAQQVAAQISKLTNTRSTVCVMHPLFGYNMVSWAGPVEMRQLFEQIAQSHDQIEVPSENCNQIALERFPYGVPEDAPVLYFLLGALTHEDDWPHLLSSSDHRVHDANKLVESALQLELAQSPRDMELPLHVGTPGLGSEGIASGLILWTTLLSEQYTFAKWDVQHQGDDRVDLLIDLDDGSIPPIQIPLRQYQLGKSGIERVLAHLDALISAATSTEDRFIAVVKDVH